MAGCVQIGAPLSFLDHHLKWGNSLIGARIKDVQGYLEAGNGETLDMFGGQRICGVMLADDLMRQVSYLSDNTVEQSRQSAAAYRDASDHLAPYKRLLDVYVSRWFGNQQPKKVETDYVRLFLNNSQTEAWLKSCRAARQFVNFSDADRRDCRTCRRRQALLPLGTRVSGSVLCAQHARRGMRCAVGGGRRL